MRRAQIMGVVILGSGLVFCSTTHGGQDTTSRVRAALSQGYESAPSGSDVEMLGPGVDTALIEIYRDPASTGLQKMRALDLLAKYPSEELKSLLDEEARRTDLQPALQRRLLGVAMRGFGEHEPQVAERLWRVNAASADPTVRYDAAQALSKIRPSAELIRAARERATVESDAQVRSELEKALATAAPR